MAHMTVCRLCSSTEQIFDVYHSHLDNGKQLRLSILLATGIQIKENDVISKMVCHRCCEIALKLHKYRNNAVANDKRLKKQAGQPYTPPVTDQDELLRIASKILDNSNSLYDSLEQLNLSIKKESIYESCAYASDTQLLQNETSAQPCERVSPDQPQINKPPTTTEHSSETDNRTDVSENASIDDKVVVTVVQHQSSKLPDFNQTVESNTISLRQCKRVPEVKHKHQSIRKIFNSYKNIVLPDDVFTSDISPIISLDSAEVSDWYAEQLSALKQKLPNINIKKLPSISNSKIPLLASTEHSEITSFKDSEVSLSEHSIETSVSKNYKIKPNCRRIADTSESDSDNSSSSISKKKCEAPANDHRKENDDTQMNSIAASVSSANQQETSPTKNVSSNNQNALNRIRKRSYTRRNSVTLENDAVNEVIPEKKRSVSINTENALNTLNEVDCPQESPPAKEKEKTVLTSSKELTPVQPEIGTNITTDTFLCRSCNKLYDTENELVNHERIHLKCKFCKKKMGNVELLNIHQNETCHVNIVNNQPSINLPKIDSIPYVVKKYANAFQKPDADRQCTPAVNFNGSEYIDYSELGLNMERANNTVPSNDVLGGLDESIANQYFMLLEEFEKNNCSSSQKNVNENNQSSDVICISDGSDDEIERTSANDTIASSVRQTEDQLLAATNRELRTPKINFTCYTRNNSSENEIISSLFKKYYSYSTIKRENGSQTYISSNQNEKCTSTNSNIKLNAVFADLFAYKIPVQLISQPNITVELKSETPANSEKQIPAHSGYSPTNAAPNNNNVVHDRPLNYLDIRPNMLNSPPANAEKQIPTYSGYSSTNAASNNNNVVHEKPLNYPDIRPNMLNSPPANVEKQIPTYSGYSPTNAAPNNNNVVHDRPLNYLDIRPNMLNSPPANVEKQIPTYSGYSPTNAASNNNVVHDRPLNYPDIRPNMLNSPPANLEKQIPTYSGYSSTNAVSNNNVVHNRSLNYPDGRLNMLNSPPNYYKSHFAQKLAMLSKRSSDVAPKSAVINRCNLNVASTTAKSASAGYTPRPPPAYNLNDTVSSVIANALGITPRSNTSQQLTNVNQSLAMSNEKVITSGTYQVPVSQNNTSVILGNNQDNVFYDPPEQLFCNNKHVNVNNYFMLSDNIQPTQLLQHSNSSSEMSYSNNTNSPPSYNQHFQRYNFGIANQKLEAVPFKTNVQLPQNSTAMLRVKKIQELS